MEWLNAQKQCGEDIVSCSTKGQIGEFNKSTRNEWEGKMMHDYHYGIIKHQAKTILGVSRQCMSRIATLEIRLVFDF